MLVIAGSTSLRTLKRAVEDVRDVLKDPKRQRPVLPTRPEVYNPLERERERREREEEREKSAEPPGAPREQR